MQGAGADPLIGKTLPGGYVIVELIGTGGMGSVYRGEQSALGRSVAIKIIHQHLLSDEASSARFITEARAASRLNHPNSVSVFDFGKTDDGAPYLVMEYLRGKDLSRVMHEDGWLPIRRVVEVIRQVLLALGQAHELGIIHRDLKPENIVLEPMRGGADFVKVVDFGLAKLQGEAQTPVDSRRVTRPGIVCGTPDYMAPEQGRGDTLDARADLYAVGVVLFLLLTGRLPFEAESPTQVVLMHLTVAPPDPRRLAPERNIPDSVAEICLKALEKVPSARYQTADEFAAALLDARRELEVQPRPASGSLCAACGHANTGSPKFCGECGARLSSASEGPTSLRPEGRKAPARVSSWPKFPLPLTGRDEDLGWLDDRLGEVEGALVAARIVGDDGAGKSRLLSEFLSRQHERGARVVETGPDPHWAEIGYHALARAIIGLAELPEGGGSERNWPSASAEAARGLSEVLGRRPAASDGLTPDDRRYLAATALRWALSHAASGGRRTILSIDDLHRVDGASRNAFADVMGEPLLAPVLVVATHLIGIDVGWSSSAAARVISGISPAAARDLIRGRSNASIAPRPKDDARGVAPLYVEHLIRFTREGGSDPPPRLADLLSLRIERLEPDARRLLQALGVLGDEVPRDRARRIAPDVQVDPAAIVLLRGGFVSEKRRGLSIAHPLLREIVAAGTPAAVRRELHERALELSDELDLPAEVRALHALGAHDTFQALVLFEQIAKRAAARGDADGTVLALRRGLEVARREVFRGELDDPTGAMVIFSRKLGEVLARGGNFTDADGVLREALDLDPVGVERGRVLVSLSEVALGRGRVAEASEHLAQAEAIDARADDPSLSGEILRVRAMIERAGR